MLAIAVASLAAAVAVYDVARVHPPDFLDAFQVTNSIVPLPDWLSGSSPSFFYALGIGLLIGLAAAPRAAAHHGLIWIGIALGFELAQLPALAATIAPWLERALPAPLWQSTAAYWTVGTFDFCDLLATLAGGLIALFLARHILFGATR